MDFYLALAALINVTDLTMGSAGQEWALDTFYIKAIELLARSGYQVSIRDGIVEIRDAGTAQLAKRVQGVYPYQVAMYQCCLGWLEDMKMNK